MIKLASGYEAATQVRAHNLPTFAATVPFDHVKGPLQAERGRRTDRSGRCCAVEQRPASGCRAIQGAGGCGACPAGVDAKPGECAPLVVNEKRPRRSVALVEACGLILPGSGAQRRVWCSRHERQKRRTRQK